MRKLRNSRIRGWRTRPSEVRAGIVMGDVDFFTAHRNSTFHDITIGSNDDPSYELRRDRSTKLLIASDLIDDKPKKPKGKIRKKKTARKKKQPSPTIDLTEAKKLNAIFEDANDFSLIIEKVAEDDYVMRANSTDCQENASTASGGRKGIVLGDESSVWYYDDSSNFASTPAKQFATSTPKTSTLLNSNHAIMTSTPKFVSSVNKPFTLKSISPFNTPGSFLQSNSATVSASNAKQSTVPCISQEEEEDKENANISSSNCSIGQTSSNDAVSVHSCRSVASNASVATIGATKNISQLAADNPLKLFYYLRGFMVEPTDINYLLHACSQARIMEWNEFLPSSLLQGCRKLGEGVYGEVFKTTINSVAVALKIIPFLDIECTFDGLVNGERMKHTLEILPELLITKDLSELAEPNKELVFGLGNYATPNFVRLVQSAVVRGYYPNELLMEWDRYSKVTKKSENDCPNMYASKNQLFIVFALSLGGRDLESYLIRNEREAFSIFFQIALSLAVGEEVLEFEHRDLHVGNVLVGQCKANDVIRYVFNNEEIVIKSCGVNVSIIDFTNSRMKREGTTIFLDLSCDKELFEGRGDYQFDIYRLMRERNKDEWKSFTPYTNILWLHYIAVKIFASKKIPAKRRKEILVELDRVLKFERIKDFLADDAIVKIFEDYVVR